TAPVRPARRAKSEWPTCSNSLDMKPRPLAVDPKSFERSGVPSVTRRHRLPLREGPSGLEGEPMHEWQDPSPVRGDCQVPLGILPKYRRKVFYGKLRRQSGAIL